MVKVACGSGLDDSSFGRRAILFMKGMKQMSTLPATLHKILWSRDGVENEVSFLVLVGVGDFPNCAWLIFSREESIFC